MPISGWDWIIALGLAALDIAACVRLVWRGQGVERTLAWMFAILAFPGIGAATYFVFASPSLRRLRVLKRAARDLCGKGIERHADVPRGGLLALASGATGLRATVGNRVELLAESEAAFTRIEDELRSARRFIWAEYYLIRTDETGRRFLDILAERARAGIEVRLLYDAIGSLGLDAGLVAEIRAAGGRVEAFQPLNPLRRRWSVHLRNHRKLVIVDGGTGFTGGMNVGDEYSGRARRRGALHFRDTHLRMSGPAVADLASVFVEDWALAAGEVLTSPEAPCPHPDGTAVVAILPSGPDQEPNASALLYLGGLGLARSRAWLTSPYFIPDEPTFRALQCAALRGVDVRLLVPDRSDVALVGPAGRSYFPALLDAGVRVFTYRPSMLHAKTMVIDSRWCVVGSANLDIRSFRLNFEVSTLIEDPAFALLLEDRFRQDLNESEEATRKKLAARSVWHKAQERVARLLSPLL